MKIYERVFQFTVYVVFAFLALGFSDVLASEEDFFNLEDTLVITATKTQIKLRDVPATMRVITEKDIRQRGYRYLEDVLRDQPGFDIVNIQGFYGSVFKQRGIDAPENLRTLLFIDGILENNVTQGSAYIKHTLALHNVKRVEILYGPASALYGANAFTGVINIITKDGADIKNWMEFGLGSMLYDTEFKRPAPYANVLIGHKFGEKADDFQFVLSGHWINTKGPVINQRDNESIPKSSYYFSDDYTASTLNHNYNFNLKLEWKGLILGFSRSNDDTGYGTAYSANFNTSLATPVAKYNYTDDYDLVQWPTISTTVYGKFILDITSKLNNTLTAYYRTNESNGYEFYQRYSGGVASYRADWYVRPGKEITVEDSLLMKWSAAMNTVIGGTTKLQDAYDYTYSPLSNVVANLDTSLLNPKPEADEAKKFDYDNLAIYAQHYWKFIDSTSITVGYRYDHFQVQGSPSGKDTTMKYETHNPRAGIVFSPSKELSVKALYGEAFRSPTVREMYSESSSRDKNYGLNPEKIRTMEFGSTYYPIKILRTELAVYGSFVKDVINLASSSVPLSTLSQYQNVGDAKVLGFDLSFTVNPISWITAYAMYTFQDARLSHVADTNIKAHDMDSYYEADGVTIKTSDKMPNVAQHKANLGVNFLLMEFINLDIRLNYVGKRPNIATNPNQSTPGYTLLNLTLGSRDWLVKNLDINFKVFNLFDAQVTDPGTRSASGAINGSFEPAQHPLPGRYFALEVMYKL